MNTTISIQEQQFLTRFSNLKLVAIILPLSDGNQEVYLNEQQLLDLVKQSIGFELENYGLEILDGIKNLDDIIYTIANSDIELPEGKFKADSYCEVGEYHRRKEEDQQFLQRFTDTRLTVVIDESDYQSGYRGLSYNPLTPQEMITWLREGKYCKELSFYQTEADLIQGLLDSSDFAISCIPTEEYIKQKENEERSRYEAIASGIVSRHQVKPYSLEFLDAVEQEMTQQSNLKQGLKEDGLCAGDGTISGWYDLSDGYQENIESLANLQRWLEQKLPLLWAQWCESKR